MRKRMMFAGLVCCLAIIGCDKDDNDTALQGHDENRMMDTMHAMMSRMNAMQPTNDPEIDFPAMMILHHQGAISMSKVQLESGSNDSLKGIAQKMTDMQQMEIGELQGILDEQSQNNSVMDFTMEQMNHMKKMDQMADVQLITGDTDNDFATLMILHHNSAIENSEAYLMYGTNEELKDMARKMIEDQMMEIEELSNWLKANKR
jgi:uncharacterized protein (DUF305 family)